MSGPHRFPNVANFCSGLALRTAFALAEQNRMPYLTTVHPAPALPLPPACPERGAWDAVRDGWARVYGSFPAWGVSVETHDFALRTDLDWARSFHEESVELCLNLDGRAAVSHGQGAVPLPPHTGIFYASMETGALRAHRAGGERHRFVTVELHRRFLAK